MYIRTYFKTKNTLLSYYTNNSNKGFSGKCQFREKRFQTFKSEIFCVAKTQGCL